MKTLCYINDQYDTDGMLFVVMCEDDYLHLFIAVSGTGNSLKYSLLMTPRHRRCNFSSIGIVDYR